MMLNAIKKYLGKRYSYEIINKLKNGKPLIAERKELAAVIPGIDEDTLEILLEKMHEDGYIIKDDGRTLRFSFDWVV